MKTLITLFVCLLLSLQSYAQQEKEITRFKMIEANVGQLENGLVIIYFEGEFNPEDVFIQLTPLDHYQQLFITDITRNSFTVKDKSGGSGRFQYIVLVKKVKVIEADPSQNECCKKIRCTCCMRLIYFYHCRQKRNFLSAFFD